MIVLLLILALTVCAVVVAAVRMERWVRADVSSVRGRDRGAQLGPLQRRSIKRDHVELARRTGSYAYRFAWDRGQLLEIRAWPTGRCQVTPMDPNGRPTGRARRLLL